MTMSGFIFLFALSLYLLTSYIYLDIPIKRFEHTYKSIPILCIPIKRFELAVHEYCFFLINVKYLVNI